MITQKQILENELLAPYIDQLEYYSKWAKIHKTAYWAFGLTQLFLSFALTAALILKKDSLYVVVFAIALNFALVMSQYLQLSKKYERYRLTEIKLQFLLLNFSNSFYELGFEDVEAYIKKNVSTLGQEIERIVTDEFVYHFRDLKEFIEFSEKPKMVNMPENV